MRVLIKTTAGTFQKNLAMENKWNLEENGTDRHEDAVKQLHRLWESIDAYENKALWEVLGVGTAKHLPIDR